MVHKKIAHQILRKEVLLGPPFNPRKTRVCEYLELIFNLEAHNGLISYVVYSLEHNGQNGQFFKILPLNFWPLKMVPGR